MSESRAPSVSIVIPAKNGRPTVGPCLDAVLAQEYDGEVEVLVIDSGSTDGTLDDVSARPSVRLHEIHPTAFDHGDTRNTGAGLTSGEAIVFLVQDAEPVGPHWLKNLVGNLDDPAVAGAFSRILPRPDAGPLVKKGTEGDLCFRSERIESRMANPDAWRMQDPHSLRVAVNFNDVSSVLRRSVWENLPFQRGMFGEDIKFARAAIEAGHTIVFDPTSEVLHSHEYDASLIYDRTFVDAELNMRYLKRPCIEKLNHVFIMTNRFWSADRAFLKQQGLSFGARLKWSLLSPLYHFKEFYGFWKGGRAALIEGGHPPPATTTPERPLKILMVVHAFPPDSWAGVEVLTLTLARALRERGHEIVLFIRTPGEPEEADRSLHESEFDGFKVHRFVNRLAFSGVDESYRFAAAEGAFERVLADEQPDVVHIQHMIHLSTGIIDRCRVAGVPSVVTLSDFWARCSRVQLIRPNRKNCLIAPPGLGCAACVKDHPKLIDPMAFTDRLLGGLVEWWAERVPQSIPPPGPGRQKNREDTASLVRREGWMREVLQRADALVVPSATLKTSLSELGIPPGRIALAAYGMDTGWLKDGPPERVPREPGEPLRVGFVGSLVWYKGLDVVAKAVAGMAPGAAHIHVHGDHEGGSDPVAAEQVRLVAGEAQQIAPDRITFHGRFHHDDMASIHAGLDVLVVPSVWQEAYGLTVREAQLSGTPVIGSDIAGIAEGIRHDTDGLLFRPGDADALRVALQRIIDEPDLGPRLAASAPEPKTDGMEAVEMEWRYRQVISARGADARTDGRRAPSPGRP
jgi:glycosyltransferase involved in cell wall biosynthesis